MKLLTLNFLTCARKACKPVATSFPLHPRDSVLEIVESEMNLLFLTNILPRLEWGAVVGLAKELGLEVRAEMPEPSELVVSGQKKEAEAEDGMEVEGESKEKEKEKGEEEVGEPSQLALDLHRLLLETTIQSGSLVCANCGHEYAIKEGIANFLLPSHLV